jgi:tetratricopeptide (TPR) repeat protein
MSGRRSNYEIHFVTVPNLPYPSRMRWAFSQRPAGPGLKHVLFYAQDGITVAGWSEKLMSVLVNRLIPLLWAALLCAGATPLSSGTHSVEALFTEALEFQKAGRLDDALAGYEKCLALDPRHYRALLGSGAVLNAKGDLLKAVKRFQGLVAMYPNDVKGRLYLGRAQLSAGQVEDARNIFRRILVDQPNSVQALIGLSRAEYTAGNRFTAVEYLKKASALQPSNQALKDAIKTLEVANREFIRLSEEAKRQRIRNSLESAIAEATIPSGAAGEAGSSTRAPNLAVFQDILEGEVKQGVLGWSNRPSDFLSPQMPSGLGY